MTITQELRLFLDYTPDQMRDLKQTGRVSDRLYRHYCFLWLWSAWRQDHRHERFYKRMGSAAYWRRIDRVRRLFLRIAWPVEPMTLSFPQAIDRLNRYSRLKWGDKAPQYSYTWRGPTNMRTYYVYRQLAEVSPFMPADDLFARGPREHCLAKVMSAIQSACR